MIRGRVLVIDGDEWLARVLVRLLEERGYRVEFCSEARVGFKKACDSRFDCIVCSPELPDIDGTWVARRIRTEPGPVAKTPFLFVGEVNDKDERVQGVHAGADVFLKRPISNEEVVAQVDALIAFSRRMGGGGIEESPSSLSERGAIRGDLSMFPLASVLMMLEMERRTGIVEIVGSSGRRATLTLAQGLFASTAIGGASKPALEVLREVLSWRAGRFSYVARENAPSMPAPRASVGALVLEAMRLEDEKKAAP